MPRVDVVEAKAGNWRLQTLVSRDYEYLNVASDKCQANDAMAMTECLFPAGFHVLKA